MITTLVEKGLETRVAITPSSTKHLIKAGFKVAIQKNAGLASGFSDKHYEDSGAEIIADAKILLKKSTILLSVTEPQPKSLTGLTKDTLLIGPIDNEEHSSLIQWSLKNQINVFSMNLIPRISRAQSLDSLSSQANLAGYRAVLEASQRYSRAIPMMMTAAGMIQPAKVLILGAGVAGLQAIATAKRLGAVVYAFDVRKVAKEQVESLGAEFIEVSQEEAGETKEGYASETSEHYKKLQGELIAKYAELADIVITTALIPGKKAPILLPKSTIKKMKPGSVIVDLATSRGGNCEGSVMDETVKQGDVTIIGLSHLARLVPTTASELYANNLVHLINLLAPKEAKINFNPEDEVIKQALICYEGRYLPFHPSKEN